jgi:hypothetical protein
MNVNKLSGYETLIEQVEDVIFAPRSYLTIDELILCHFFILRVRLDKLANSRNLPASLSSLTP